MVKELPYKVQDLLPLVSYTVNLLSQKASGIRDLANYGIGHYSYVTKMTRVLHEGNVDAFSKLGELEPPVFVRPCPTNPQHGFVESRLIKHGHEILKVVEEIKATGEPIEILVCPYVEAEWSAVITPETMTVGPGNDGATSKNSLSLKTVFPIKELTYKAVLPNDPAIPKGENHPFVEVVSTGLDSTWSSSNSLQVVQLRRGPQPPTSPDYVPGKKPFHVSNVMVAEEQDLLEWQAAVKNAGPGTVIYLNGKGWTSHFAIHGISAKIPVISTHLPEVGEILQPTSVYEPKQEDFDRLARYISYAFNIPTISSAKDIKPCFAAFHHFGLWTTFTEAECKMMAWTVATFVRITFALGAGEMRHYPNCVGKKYGAPVKMPPMWSWLKPTRGKCYQLADAYNFPTIATMLPHMVKDFREANWGSSYGGMTWSIGAERAKIVVELACAFLKNPNAESWGEVVNAMNNMAYSVHNGGRFHNKLIEEVVMDQISNCPGPALLEDAYRILYKEFGWTDNGTLEIVPADEADYVLQHMPVIPVKPADEAYNENVPEFKVPTLPKKSKKKKGQATSEEAAPVFTNPFHKTFEQKLEEAKAYKLKVQQAQEASLVKAPLNEWKFIQPQGMMKYNNAGEPVFYVHAKLAENYKLPPEPEMFPKIYLDKQEEKSVPGVGFLLSVLPQDLELLQEALYKAKKETSLTGSSTPYSKIEEIKVVVGLDWESTIFKISIITDHVTGEGFCFDMKLYIP